MTTTININGQYLGLYIMVESVNKPYLRKHYSHFMTRLATDELTKIDKNLRSSRKVQKLMMKDDFVLLGRKKEG